MNHNKLDTFLVISSQQQGDGFVLKVGVIKRMTIQRQRLGGLNQLNTYQQGKLVIDKFSIAPESMKSDSGMGF